MKQGKKDKHDSRRNILKGIISISQKGTGYVTTEVFDDDVEIGPSGLNTALHGDTVEIAVLPQKPGRKKGEVVRIIRRAKTGFAGVLEKKDSVFFLRPDDTRMYADVLIPENFLGQAKPGQKVFAEIVSWSDSRKPPEGKITKILGSPGDNDTEMHSIAIEKGFDHDLSRSSVEEAEAIKRQGIRPADYDNRRDFRKTLTFTIDPEDAKDFDDALSFKFLTNNEYEIGIHIADVSHYVKEGGQIDEEAKKRGTSVYLVDRTIPMLPEILSNDLCSLVPNKDRLTMSAVFVMDKNAKVKNAWFGRTVIHSQKRFTYEEAETTIKKPALPLHKELSILNHIAKLLTAERFAKGAISLEQEEVKFVLDKDGTPLKVIKKQRGDSNKLIEEFMLLANKKVAELLSGIEVGGSKKYGKKEEGIFIYRIHDKPSREKMLDLHFFLSSLGHKIRLQNGIISNFEINKLLKSLAGKSEEDTVQRAIVRSMAKAIYSTKNVGHYGLAFEHYTHFTSPIRRYPDIMVHRFLISFLHKKKISQGKWHEYEAAAQVSSEQEKRAAEAERASIKYKQAEYMSKRIGEKFEGIISGLTEWGLYVEEKETKSEGLVRIRDLSDDFYIFNEKKLEFIGQKKKKRYRFGDKVKFKVKAVDLERKTIDYVLMP